MMSRCDALYCGVQLWQETTESWDGIITGSPAFRAPETLLPGGRLTRKVIVTLASQIEQPTHVLGAPLCDLHCANSLVLIR